MKKLLLASVLAIASFPGNPAHAAWDSRKSLCEKDEECAAECMKAAKTTQEKASCRAIVEDSADIKACHAAGGNRETCEQHAPGSRDDMACYDDGTGCRPCKSDRECDEGRGPPPARVTVAPPYQGPPPIGWVYGPYTQCADPPRCSMGVVNVPADGLNVRTVPNGPPVMSLVNGTPLIPLQKQGDRLLVAPACDLTPTWAWSWNAGVPLNRCWVYF